MIISRTPFRVSFFGGGTDYPAWFKVHGGAVLTTTIDKYCYISCRYLPPFFEFKHRLVYSVIETVKEISEVKHPAVRAVLTHVGAQRGLEIHHDGDLPARSGLGSSSSFTVGMLNTLKALEGKIVSKEDLAREAIFVEQEVIKEAVGSQDQIAAAFGGLNRIDFLRDGSFTVNPVILKQERKDEFQSHLLLFFTGFSRFAADVARTKIDNFGNRETELKKMYAMVSEACSILQSQTADIQQLGELLHQSWQYKRSLSKTVSNPEIDEIYQAGISAGATGGKLLGAGGGGFMLFFAPPHKHAAVKERLKNLINVSFKFDNDGSKIVLYSPTM